VGAASASGAVKFKGKLQQGPKVTFRATATKVIGFSTSVSALCSSMTTGRHVGDVRPLAFPTSPLRNGHFKITLKIPPISLVATATGTVKRTLASGALKVSYMKSIGTTPTGLIDFATCLAKTTWKAKRA
jgi:hypothetical protein